MVTKWLRKAFIYYLPKSVLKVTEMWLSKSRRWQKCIEETIGMKMKNFPLKKLHRMY